MDWKGRLRCWSATYPDLVEKLILVSSGPFLDKYTSSIKQESSPKERKHLQSLLNKLSSDLDKEKAFAELGRFSSQIDAYHPLAEPPTEIQTSYEIYERISAEFSALRKSGGLLDLGRKITCPVVAIHGELDPHPAEGVREPLSRVVRDFRVVLLRKCGHTPWKEREAHKEFYSILKRELD